MKSNRIVPIWASVVLIALCLTGLAYNIWDFTQMIPYGFSAYIVCVVIAAIATILAILYCINGFGKNARLYFKAFCLFTTINQAVYLYQMALSSQYGNLNAILFFLETIHFAAWCTITFSTDLGRKKSTLICAIALIYPLVPTIELWTSIGWLYGLKGISLLLSNTVFAIMVYGKYKDKEERGTN